MKLSVLAGLASAVLALILILRVDTEKPTESGNAMLVATEITALKTRRYDEDGELLERASADHLIQYDSDEQMLMTGVNVTQLSHEDGLWTLAAPQGIGNDTDNSLELSGGVNIANGTAVLMTTDTMLINSDDRIAKSGGEVVLMTQKSETTADGLIINLSTNTATLAGNVSTEYRTERSP